MSTSSPLETTLYPKLVIYLMGSCGSVLLARSNFSWYSKRTLSLPHSLPFSTAKDGQLALCTSILRFWAFVPGGKKGVKPYHRYALFEVKVTFATLTACFFEAIISTRWNIYTRLTIVMSYECIHDQQMLWYSAVVCGESNVHQVNVVANRFEDICINLGSAWKEESPIQPPTSINTPPLSPPPPPPAPLTMVDNVLNVPASETPSRLVYPFEKKRGRARKTGVPYQEYLTQSWGHPDWTCTRERQYIVLRKAQPITAQDSRKTRAITAFITVCFNHTK